MHTKGVRGIVTARQLSLKSYTTAGLSLPPNTVSLLLVPQIARNSARTLNSVWSLDQTKLEGRDLTHLMPPHALAP